MPPQPPPIIPDRVVSTPAINQPGVGVCLGSSEISSFNTANVDFTTWHQASDLSSLYGRMISGVGLGFTVSYLGVDPAWAALFGPETISDICFDACSFDIKWGDTVKASFPASVFKDTKKLQRILEVPIKPPYPNDNAALNFRIYSAHDLPIPPFPGSYTVLAIIKTLFPPIPNAYPAKAESPRGLGLIRVK